MKRFASRFSFWRTYWLILSTAYSSFPDMVGKHLLGFVASVLVIAPSFLGCPSVENPPRPLDLLLAGTDPSYPPFAGLDSVSGAMSGFDVELISLISKANQWRYQDTSLSYDDLLPALRRGDIDIVASGLPMPADAHPDIACSDPYYLVSRVLVLRVADSLITGLEDLPVGLLGVVSGTNMSILEKRVRKTKTYPRKDLTQALAELADGTLAAMIVDYPLARVALTNRTDFRMCSASLGYEYYVFAMRNADSLRLRRLNDALAALVGGYSYEQLHKRWFGYPPLNLAVPDSVSDNWPTY